MIPIIIPVYGALRPSTAAACRVVVKDAPLGSVRRPFSLPFTSVVYRELESRMVQDIFDEKLHPLSVRSSVVFSPRRWSLGRLVEHQGQGSGLTHTGRGSGATVNPCVWRTVFYFFIPKRSSWILMNISVVKSDCMPPLLNIIMYV